MPTSNFHREDPGGEPCLPARVCLFLVLGTSAKFPDFFSLASFAIYLFTMFLQKHDQNMLKITYNSIVNTFNNLLHPLPSWQSPRPPWPNHWTASFHWPNPCFFFLWDSPIYEYHFLRSCRPDNYMYMYVTGLRLVCTTSGKTNFCPPSSSRVLPLNEIAVLLFSEFLSGNPLSFVRALHSL